MKNNDMGILANQTPMFLQALGAAKIIDDGNGTMYVCTLDASLVDKSTSALPLEQQAIWQIKRVQETTTDGITTTTIMFPNGRNAFAFVASNYSSYTYNYSL